jgi:hypothetical protein
VPTTSILPSRRATAVLLVVAALGSVAEAVSSPLRGGSTADDLSHIAVQQSPFTASVLIGLASTLLYIPGFLGLAESCCSSSPRMARVAGWLLAGAMCGFVAVRTLQAVELQAVREGLELDTGARLVDHAGFNPIVAPLLVLFLGGALVGMTCMAVVAWRAGFPKVACVLLGAFQVVDLVIPGRPLISHLVLLLALAWLGRTLWVRPPAGAPSVVAQPIAV